MYTFHLVTPKTPNHGRPVTQSSHSGHENMGYNPTYSNIVSIMYVVLRYLRLAYSVRSGVCYFYIVCGNVLVTTSWKRYLYKV